MESRTADGGLHTLGRWTTDRAASTPDRVAIDDRGVLLRYADLDRRAAALADAFASAGYRTGDRVATITGNSADHVVAFFACAKAGLVLVPLSWRLTTTELAEQLAHADVAVLLFEPELEAQARAAVRADLDPPPVTALGEAGVERAIPAPRRPELIATGEAVGRRRLGEVRDDDPLIMIFTSGTAQEGPKAAVLTHANCFWTNLSLSRTAEVSGSDVVLAVLPQFHVAGWNVQPLLAWWAGATVVLERTFDAGRVLHLIEQRGVTTMMGVPTQYLMLSEHRDFAGADLSSMRTALVGGGPMPAPLLRTWHARGVALAQGYGLTEASPNVLCLPPEQAAAKAGWAGRPYPHVEVAVADPVTGEQVRGAGSGELLVRGPGVFAGYFRDPAATAAVVIGGWLHTGDIVERDREGDLRVIDRLRNIYISGGENVAPAEVESVLRAHPAVAEAAVVGVPDQRWGEVGAALVVRRPGAATDAEDLLDHCRRQLSAPKVPRSVTFVERLPVGELGKIRRAGLSSLVTGHVGADASHWTEVTR